MLAGVPLLGMALVLRLRRTAETQSCRLTQAARSKHAQCMAQESARSARQRPNLHRHRGPKPEPSRARGGAAPSATGCLLVPPTTSATRPLSHSSSDEGRTGCGMPYDSRSAASLRCESASATPSCSRLLPKCSRSQAHHPGEIEKSQPKLIRVCLGSTEVQAM
jgi:hypothetical protein